MTMAVTPDASNSAFLTETVTGVKHWNDTLFSFTTTRDRSLRFKTGQFLMIGLMVDGRPLVRAYSIASPCWADELEFYSIKVQDGPLTSRLQHLRVGDRILVGRKPTGSLIMDNLRPGGRLILLASGTGLAPFMSVIRDPEFYAAFPQIILAHGVRLVSELGYHDYITSELTRDPYLGEQARQQLFYYPLVTREPFPNQGHVTILLEPGQLESRLGLPGLDPARDRIMICGSSALLRDAAGMARAAGFTEGTSNQPGEYVIERAFVGG